MNKECIPVLEKIEAVVAKYEGLIGKDARLIQGDLGLQNAATLTCDIEQIKSDGRLLQIGVVGRVKAGKSSLLNALLFDGESVLPKAATPMTAALTTLSYGESMSARAEFYTAEDIHEIKRNAQEYERLYDIKTTGELEQFKQKERNRDKPEPELLAKARKRAQKEMRSYEELDACFDQAERIKAASISYAEIEEFGQIEAASYEVLRDALYDYVGADGRYMPFTKAVNIQLPLKVLENVQIIDTPGMNDPVASREERTRELLKYCDVVLVVSSMGSFISAEDLDLMDRIGTKEGVRELYVVASQIDMQLHGSERAKFGGKLPDVVKGIASDASERLKKTLEDLKKSNPEIGTVFDQLINEADQRVLHSSGISKTISNCCGQFDQLDDGEQTAFNNLLLNYSDYFSKVDWAVTDASLKLLANMESISSALHSVRNQKDQIIGQKIESYQSACAEKVSGLGKELLVAVKKNMEELRIRDIADVQKKITVFGDLCDGASAYVDGEYADLIDELSSTIKKSTRKEIDSIYRASRLDIDDSSKSETTTEKRKKSGFFNWVAGLWGGGYESYTETYTTVRSGAVRDTLVGFIDRIGEDLGETVETDVKAWRKLLKKTLLNALREKASDEYLDMSLIEKAIRQVVSKIQLPDISYDRSLPDNLSARGTLKRSQAEEYLENAGEFVRELKGKVTKDTKSYISRINSDLSSLNVSKMIFGQYNDELAKLKEQLESRELILREYERCIEELNNVGL